MSEVIYLLTGAPGLLGGNILAALLDEGRPRSRVPQPSARLWTTLETRSHGCATRGMCDGPPLCGRWRGSDDMLPGLGVA